MNDWVLWVFIVWLAYVTLGLQRRIEKLEAEIERGEDA